MINMSEKVADSYRTGTNPKADPNNPVTSRRRKLYSLIKTKAGGNAQAEYDHAITIISRERPKLEAYVISKNEVPLDNINDLILQAYELRANEIDSVSNMIGVSDGEANIFLEDDESANVLTNNPDSENFTGELFAPVGIAAKHLQDKPDNFVDPNLIGGIINTIGGKVNAADLKRAANNKPPGILGFLGQGGASGYNALRAYLQKPENSDEKAKVLTGQINDISMLRGYAGQVANQGGVSIAANNVIDQIAAQKRREAINKALPFIIIGVIVIILVTVLIVRNAKHK